MIKICIPYYSEHKTAEAGVKTLSSRGLEYETFYGRSALVAQARNALINGALSNKIRQELDPKYSHYLFVDSDIGFNYRHLEAALAHNKNILTLPYLQHKATATYAVGTFSDKIQGIVGSKFTPSTKGLRTVDWCGAGFLLVKACVFNRMNYPWFRYGLAETDGKAEIVSEDIGFCLAATKLGYKIWCDFDFPVYHKPRETDFIT